MDRRTFLRAGGGALVLGFTLPGCLRREMATAPAGTVSQANVPVPGAGQDVSAWVRIGADGAVQLSVPEAEMGQGVHTALAQILADELGLEWDAVQVFHAPADEATFGRQSTGGSTSIRHGEKPTRLAAAAAREMLVGAAAAEWGVDVAQCEAVAGRVTGPEGRSASFGQLAEGASRQPMPTSPALRAGPARYVGRPMPRLDVPSKVDGTAVFGLDVRLPEGMRFASIERSPTFGGTVAEVDDTAARAVRGVVDVVTVDSGVAVVAEHTWAALKGREALRDRIRWSEGPHPSLSSEQVRQACVEALAGAKKAEGARGDVARGIEGATKTLAATYDAPYLAHTAMEPLSCTARVTEGGCDLWVATQSPTACVKAAAKVTGLPESSIRVHSTMLGGGFGRRSHTDYVEDALHVAKAVDGPVQVVWSRTDDVRAGWYRPVAHNVLQGGVDERGLPVVWSHRLASPFIRGYDGPTTEGAANLPYAVPDFEVRYADVSLPVPVWWWRSVGSSQNAWVTECFFDELCRLGGSDPVEARVALLAAHPRHVAVLKTAAERAGWGTPLPEGRARGVAVHHSFDSVVAQVVEVSIDEGQVRVHRVVCAVDCGQVINPDTVVAQMESGIVYGLSAALHGEITFADGRVQQSNFHDYAALRMSQMPSIETHLVPSGDAHGGIGEPGTPPIAPAVCNAVLALTGTPVRSLPIRLA
ncbi:MAG: xanthine dehydrogenase family protein molybdopterin-binding subunit [Myxococcales bacterium]|nr:xanthine dehydrogenase family protein molybdopterin-binding subunit [Myxococcales bacterium]